MGAVEFVSPEGLRQDGRRPREARAVCATVGVVPCASGSCEFRMGQTIAVAAVYGPREPAEGVGRERLPQGGEGAPYVPAANRGVLGVEYAEAQFAAAGMRSRGVGRTRAADSQAVLRSALEATVLLSQLARSRVDVRCHVLASDGGALACAINAASIALADAGVPMRDLVAAVEVGHLDGHGLLDCTHQEQLGGGPKLLVSMHPSLGEVVAADCEGKVATELFDALAELAAEGARGVGAEARKALAAVANARAARADAKLRPVALQQE